MPRSNSSNRSKRRKHKRASLSLAQDLCDGVPNCGSSLLDLFLGQTEGNADLQAGGHNLLRLEVVLQGLETGD